MKKGFSIVELSVVLVIIGLIIGGIVVGRNMVESSKIQAAIADLSKYKEAAIGFKNKYNYWAGDMPNAYDYWGTPANCTNVQVLTDANGCNGNGDGIISINGTNYAEITRGIQFLALAGYIPGTYSGKSTASPDGTGSYAVPGVNIPASPTPTGNTNLIPKTGYFYTTGSFIGNTPNYTGTGTSNKIVLEIYGPSIQASYAIDQKIDDGLPQSGNIILLGLQCSTGSNAYALNQLHSCQLAERME